MKQAKTYSAKPSQVTRQWYVIDASTATLGRVSTLAATYLTGKHKPGYTPHIDVGDGVIITNAAKLKVTGNKLEQKIYYKHSGYTGSLKETTLSEQIAKDPRKIIETSVRGMLAVNKLRDGRLKRLKVYTDDKHEQEAQKPVNLEVK